MSEQGDISTVAQYKWYDWCYYKETGKNQLGRLLGPSKNEGKEMAQYILKMNGQVVPMRTTRPLTKDEWESESEYNKCTSFDAAVKAKFGDSISLPSIDGPIDLGIDDFMMESYEPVEEAIQHVIIIEDENSFDVNENLMFEEPIDDILINIEYNLPLKDRLHPAIDRKKSIDMDPNVIA